MACGEEVAVFGGIGSEEGTSSSGGGAAEDLFEPERLRGFAHSESSLNLMAICLGLTAFRLNVKRDNQK